MKICFLAGANSIHSIRWIRYFVNAGENISWISLKDPLPEAEDIIKRTAFFKVPLTKKLISLLKLPAKILRVKSIIARVKPDILHAHYAGLYGLIGALLNFHPFIVTVWGSDVLVFPSTPMRKRIIRFILRKADLVTVDGYNTKEVVENFGVPAQKIHRIQFGVDVEKFSPRKNRKHHTVVSLRGLEPIYSVDTLIEAASSVITKTPDARFIIAGEGLEKQRLVELAKKFGVQDHVQFIGKIAHDKLPEIISLASVYVSTSLSDSGLSMSTAEAMACGLPVIVTDTSDNKNWVKEGEGGFVVPCRNPGALAEKISYLFTHPDLSRSFGTVNRNRIEKDNNYRREMEKMGKLYKNIHKNS